MKRIIYFVFYFIDTFSLVLVFFRSIIKVVISGSQYLVSVRNTPSKTYG